MSRGATKRDLLSRIQREISRIRNSLKSLKHEEVVLEKRMKYIQEIINPSKKRKRDTIDDLTLEDEKSPKKLKVDEEEEKKKETEPSYRSQNRRGGRKPVAGDEKQKARGKRFMKFLNIQLIHHRKQIKKVKKPKLEEEEEEEDEKERVSPRKVGTANIFRKSEAAKEEGESLRKEKDEIVQKIRNLEKRLETLQDFFSRYENQLKRYHCASYLKTKTEPFLYYKPRVMTKEMEAKIEMQKKDEILSLQDLEKEAEGLV